MSCTKAALNVGNVSQPSYVSASEDQPDLEQRFIGGLARIARMGLHFLRGNQRQQK